MASEDTDAEPKRPRIRRRFFILAFVVVAVAVLWSVFWFVAAAYAERMFLSAVDNAIAEDVAFDCADRRIAGYPFRIELWCGNETSLTLPEATITVAGVTAVALVYDPRRVIVEFAGPAEISDAPFPDTTVEWSLAHASVALDGRALGRFSLSIKEPRASALGLPPLVASLAEAHVRADPSADEAVDVAVRLDGIDPVAGEPKLDLLAVAVVKGLKPLLAGNIGGLAQLLNGGGGLPIELSQLKLQADKTQLSAAGDLLLRPDGTLDGDISVAVAADGASLPYLEALAPAQADTLSKVVNTVLSFGKATQIDGAPARAFPLTISAGRVSAGLLPLGRIPPAPLAVLFGGG